LGVSYPHAEVCGLGGHCHAGFAVSEAANLCGCTGVSGLHLKPAQSPIPTHARRPECRQEEFLSYHTLGRSLFTIDTFAAQDLATKQILQ
jgi:hypothetical protein